MTDLNERLKAACELRGLVFRPWEVPPWQADGKTSPYPSNSAGGQSWPKAVRLRARLLAELTSG